MDYNKGKCTYTEVYEMPNRMFHTLYVRLIKKLSTENGKNEIIENEIQEKLEEEVSNIGG